MKVDPRFLTASGPEIFTGNELLLKGALEAEGGVHLLGGYPGSPISGFFDSMPLIKDLLNEKGIRAVINNNEALAGAMLNGSQVASCRGIICMKSVGVHVAADSLALGNLAGAHPDGGAIVIYGDDPWSDSTQVPADSRYISKHLFIPVIEPANAQEGVTQRPRSTEPDKLLEHLLEIGIFRLTADKRIHVPDIYLSGFGLKRKGGIRRPVSGAQSG